MLGVSVSVNAASIYNVNGDIDESGKEIIDIRDLVLAKKLSVDNSGAFDAEFFVNLRCILLGIDEPRVQNSGGGAIYLPIVP